ncbi:protein lava lamp [Rhineura floridana]|uniref:protein lava lamp n=1 Tax=Rhineura floridana TaxID=261503 RepID=UPI002AC85752|nr:protein lava lamp [Rhineura floridana]
MKPAKKVKDPQFDSLLGEKKRGKLKYEPEPMVLLPSVPPESVAQYSLALPSTNKDRMLDEMDTLRNITEHLNQIVQTMEDVYENEDETKGGGRGEEEGEPIPPKEEHEDMTSFLICCSQLSNQLDCALHEEKQILESLLKWFEKEVHEMEELGEEEIIPDWQIPVADKNISNNINKLLDRIQRLEDLKGRIQELPKLIQISAPKQEKKKPLSPAPPVQKDPKNIIEELAMKHATEDVMNMVQVFQDDTGQPQTIESMNNRMLEIMKVFERQTNKLHRVANEQDVLEGKLQKIQHEFRKLAEEKEIMEDELQKMKASEQQEKGMPDARKKMISKMEKVKVEEKPQVITEKLHKWGNLPSKQKEFENQKMKEDLAKAQAEVQSLEQEKKMLEEKLQKALEEAEQAKIQLAEIPPNIPDWQFPYTAIAEDDKDVQKKGKKATKSKGKGEDQTDLRKTSVSGTDRTIHQLQRPDTGKDISTVPQTRDVKHKTKGSIYVEPDKGLSEGLEKELTEGTSGVTDKRLEESRKTKAGKSETVDSKGSAKSKETAEMKKRRPITKGAGKETYRSPVSEFSPLPSVKEKQQLPDSTGDKEKTLDKSPEEILPPDSKRRKTEITISPQRDIQEEEESLRITEQKASPLSEMKVSVEPKEIMGESKKASPAISPEQALAVEEEIPEIYIGSVELQEDKTRDLVNKRMLQLADHLTELEGMPEAETLSRLLLEPGKNMELLSDRQKLQLLDQLITPDGLLLPEEEETEQKRRLLSEMASTLQLLQQTQAPEVSQSEEEINEMTEKRRALLANLDSDLKDLQQTEALRLAQQDIGSEINKLSENRSLLLSSMESNMRDLELAQALAATEPSEMNENKVKELLQQRELLTANLEANLQDLQRGKALKAVLGEKDKPEKEIDELSKQRKVLLASLKSNLKDLEEAEALAAIQPGSVSDKKIEELKEQRKVLAAHLEKNQQDLQMVQTYAPGLARDSRLQEMKLSSLSEKKKLLQEKLDSNLKDLQQAEMLASLQPDSINVQKLQELTEERCHLTEDLKATVNSMQEIQRHASQRTLFIRPSERGLNELYDLAEKKQLLLEKLASNRKELQEAQDLATTQPGSVSEHKLQELAEQRRHLTADLEATLDDIQNVYRRASERPLLVQPGKRNVYELSLKKQELLEKLEFNQKQLEEAQALAVAQPGSISDHKLQELSEQRRYLAEDLETTVQELQKAQDIASEGAVITSERELYELSSKKEELLEKLESNWKELLEAQALAIAQPGSISEDKVQELAEQRKHLTKELERTVHDIVEAEHQVSERDAEMELYELSLKKQLLKKKLESNRKELEEAEALAAAEPGSISEHKLQELTVQRRHLAADLKETVHDIKKAERRASERAQEPAIEMELYKLSVKKNMLQEKLEFNQKELEQAQALEAAQPGSVSEHKLQELAEQRRNLTEDLKATIYNIKKAQRRSSERAQLEQPTERELFELSVKKQLLQANLESNWKELQEAQALAATQPGSISEHKLQELTEQRRHLAADLKETMHDIQKAERHASERAQLETSTGRKLYDLLEKKHLLEANLESNWENLQEAQALAATQPASITDYILEKLAEERRRLTEDLDATVHDILEAHHQASEKSLTGKPAEKELYELSEGKQLLLENLKGLQEAQALAATQPGSIGEEKRKQLAERLAADLEATMHDLQKAQRQASEIPLTVRPSEKKVYELSEKKSLLLESLAFNRKQLQGAQALAALHPGSISDYKLEELIEERKLLTEELRGAVHDLQEIQHHTSQRVLTGKPIEELTKKKQQLLERLEANQKELEEAEVLDAAQSSSISKHRLQELAEERKRLTIDLEETLHNIIIQEVKHHASKPSEKELYKLSEWKQHLLDDLESNLKEIEVQALAATKPGSVSEKKMQKLNEQRKILAENLESVVEDTQKMKARISEAGGVMRPIEKDLNGLLRKKKLFLERLDSNLKNLLEAQTLAATHPGRINEMKVQGLTEQRRLLAAGLEAIIQELQDIQGVAPEELGITKSREMALQQLFEKKRVFLENLASNLKDLKQAQALAAAEPGGINEQKVQELVEQRRLLTVGLGAVLQSIQDAESLISGKVKIVKPSEIELDKLSEKRRLLLENMELNLKELKDLLALPIDSMSEPKMQELTHKRKLLAAGLEEIIQHMQESQRLELDQEVMTRPDERNINDLMEFSRLESKLDEIQEVGALSDIQLDHIREKIHKLKEQKRSLIDKWEVDLLKEYSEEYITGKPEREKAVKEFLGKKGSLFSHLQSSIKDLQKGFIRHTSIPEKRTQELSEEKTILDDYLMGVPIELLHSDAAALSAKYGPDDKKSVKRRALAAKLEANIRDLQAAFETRKIETPRYADPRSISRTAGRQKVSITEPSDHQLLKQPLSGLQIHISKVPGFQRVKPDNRKIGVEFDTSAQEQQEQLLKREIDLTCKRQLAEQLPENKISLPRLYSSSTFDRNANRFALENALQEILEYNKNLLPGHRANLQQALQLAQNQLLQKQQQEQQVNLLVEKFRNMSVFSPQPPGTARFHDYTVQTQKSAWETNQLPQKDYLQKLQLLRRKILGPEIKGGGLSSPSQAASSLASQEQETGSIVICGKGCNPYRNPGCFPVIKQRSRYD